MKTKKMTINAEIITVFFRNCSTYGNPSYFVVYRYGKIILTGYTGANYSIGYEITNFHEHDEVKITYHTTSTGKVIIDDVKRR